MFGSSTQSKTAVGQCFARKKTSCMLIVQQIVKMGQHFGQGYCFLLASCFIHIANPAKMGK